eukprot:Lankesteria_metandrocarpae@DN5315_c0_g1_i1.p1
MRIMHFLVYLEGTDLLICAFFAPILTFLQQMHLKNQRPVVRIRTMISDTEFWETEGKAPLLNRNAGFLSPDKANSAKDVARKWLDLVEAYCKKCAPEDNVAPKCMEAKAIDEAMLRIYKLDAERTFTAEKYRRIMVNVLKAIHVETQDYHQGMGFVVAFLLLYLNEDEVIQFVIALHRHYLQGYFRAGPVNYIRNAKIFEKVLKAKMPLPANKITECVAAEAYCSKWFIGLNVHVLTFAALKTFFDAFLVQGHDFLYKFGLALVKVCEEDIMTAKDVSKILAILRLDALHYPNDYKCYNSGERTTNVDTDETEENFFCRIIDTALATDISDVDLEKLGIEVDEEMEAAAERRRQRDAELGLDDDDEIVFSDEEE